MYRTAPCCSMVRDTNKIITSINWMSMLYVECCHSYARVNKIRTILLPLSYDISPLCLIGHMTGRLQEIHNLIIANILTKLPLLNWT